MPLQIRSAAAGSKELYRVISATKGVEEVDKNGPSSVTAYLSTSAPVQEVKDKITSALGHYPDLQVA